MHFSGEVGRFHGQGRALGQGLDTDEDVGLGHGREAAALTALALIPVIVLGAGQAAENRAADLAETLTKQSLQMWPANESVMTKLFYS